MRMRRVAAPSAMQRQALKWRREGTRVALVPTMGYLHEGHLSLVQTARKCVGRQGRVVLSIYVNPTQFGPKEDLAAYPRDLRRDLALCRAAGVDLVFTPDDAAMYPGRAEGLYSTYVTEDNLARRMEGASRPTHFRGVTTVVAKLFNLTLPDFAVFGAKDWQQAQVVRRMTADLNFPVRVIVAETVREPDGLAMSSRNTYLTPDQRAAAASLHRALELARQRVRSQGAAPAAALRRLMTRGIEANEGFRVDYIEFFDGATLAPVATVRPGARAALAVFAGSTRLIDNAEL